MFAKEENILLWDSNFPLVTQNLTQNLTQNINFITALALYLFDGSRNVEESMKKMILTNYISLASVLFKIFSIYIDW